MTGREGTSQRLYRSRSGVVLGVCRGLANFTGLGTIWIRLALFAAFMLTGFWPMLLVYIAAALIVKLEPVLPVRTEASEEFYRSYVDNRSMAVRRLKRTYDDMHRRIQRIEDIVTSRDFQWEHKMES